MDAQDSMNENLDMKGSTWTKYGQAYKQKAQAIGLNRVLIDLDKTSQELAIEFKDDPIGYATEMSNYSATVKEQLPENMHEAYEQKMQISKNGYEQKIYENVTKQQNDELAAVTQEKMDITRTNLLDAAVSDNPEGYLTAKVEYKTQLQSLVKNGIITQTVADDLYRSADIEATQQLVMSSFTKKLAKDPQAAIDFATEFAGNTSQQQYGTTAKAREEIKAKKKKKPKNDRANTLDLEYDTIERDKMSKMMAAQIKKYETALKAGNKQSRTDNNALAKQAIEAYKSGSEYFDQTGMLVTAIPGVTIGVKEFEDLAYWKKYQPDVALYKTQPTIQMEAELKSIKDKKVKSGDDMALISVYEKALEDKKALLKTDPGAAAFEMVDATKLPAYNPASPLEYSKAMLSATNFLNSTENTEKYLLSNVQAEQAKAFYDNLGYKDQLSYINSMGNGPEAKLFFEQLGGIGSDTEVIHNIVSGRGPQAIGISETILRGKEQIKLKTNVPFKRNEAVASYQTHLNGRGEGMDEDTKKAYMESTIAYAVATNPEREIDDADIQAALDNVFGAVGDLGGDEIDGSTSFYRFDNTLNENMMIYSKSVSKVESYIENVTTDQIESTFPTSESVFYSSNPSNPLSSKVIQEEIQLGMIQMIGTGINGEYVMKRRGQYVYTSEPTATTDSKGYVWTPGTLYKLQLWGN